MAKAKERVNKRNILRLQAPPQAFFVAEVDCSGKITARSVIAKSEATKQSMLQLCRAVDCFAEPVIGRAFARPVGSQCRGECSLFANDDGPTGPSPAPRG